MNFNVAYVFSVYHPLFYLINIIIVGRFLQRSFQNHIGCGITFAAIMSDF